MSNRLDILKKPGKIILDAAGTSATLWSSTGISVELQETLVMLPNVAQGESTQVVTGRMVEVRLQPTQFTAGVLAKLFTHGAVRKGGSILASTDKTLDVHTVDGQRLRIPCAYVYQEPAIRFLPGQTLLGEVVFRGIVGLTGNPNALASFWSRSSAAFSYSDWNPDHEITPVFNVDWSGGEANAWADILTTGQGLTLTPTSELTDDISGKLGLINTTIKNYGVDIAGEVLNISEELVEAAMGFDTVKLGGRKTSLGKDLILRSTTEDAFITAYNAVLQPGYSFRYNAENTVVGNLTWKTDPLVATGVKGAHLLVTTTDPEA